MSDLSDFKSFAVVAIGGEDDKRFAGFEAVAHLDGCDAVLALEHDRRENKLFGGLSFVKANGVEIVTFEIRVRVSAVRHGFEVGIVFLRVLNFARLQVFVYCVAVGVCDGCNVKLALHPSFDF